MPEFGQLAALDAENVDPCHGSQFCHLERPQGVGHLVAAIAVSAFGPAEAFARRVERLARDLSALPPMEGHERVYRPGEIEHRRSLEYGARGIPLPPEVVGEMEALAAELGLPAPASVQGPGDAAVHA